MLRPVLALLLCLHGTGPLLCAQAKRPDASKLPATLDLLPTGSTLKDVRIPRYDENKLPAAFISASMMEVISENYVHAKDLRLQILNPDASKQLTVKMKAADYHVSRGVLEALENITIFGDRFRAEGKGAIFQLDARRGFLHGPVSTSFLPEPTKTSMNLPNTLPSLLVGLTGMAIAAPEVLTTTELQEYERITASESDSLLEEIAPTREINVRTDQLSQLASVGLENFARELNHNALLTLMAAEAPKLVQNAPKPDPDGLHVTCDGGMYFDAEKGHVVYLKNVLVKEPRFTMRAGKELKIFLEKKAGVPAPEEKEKEDEGGMKMPGFDGPANFSDVKNIIATGGVEVIKKDDKGKPITATAATATYDAKTGDIILRGGFPLVQQGKQFIRAKEAGLYIRIYASGDIYWQPGKWETFANREELEKNRK